MATNTSMNIGLRRFIYALNEYRNFQPGGVTHYIVAREGILIGATHYHVGDSLALGVLPDERLEILWNAGEIDPAT